MKDRNFITIANKGSIHDTTMPLLEAAYSEFRELSKKKPDAAVSKKKIDIVNRLLTKIRDVLSDEESIIFLDLLDEDDIPQVSEVTLILSQYVAAMSEFRKKYKRWAGLEEKWATK